MSKEASVSVLWLLGLILVTLLWAGRCLSEIGLLLHAQNMTLMQWRKQFGETFQYVNEDEANANDLYGDDEQGAHSGR